MIYGCGDSLLRAWISLKLLTYKELTAVLLYLLDRVEVVFHALDGHVFTSLDALRLEHFGKGAFALLANQSVF